MRTYGIISSILSNSSVGVEDGAPEGFNLLGIGDINVLTDSK